MSLYKTFLEVYIFLMCVNGMLLVGNALLGPDGDDLLTGDAPMGTPFDVSTDLTISNSTLALTAPDSVLAGQVNATSSSNPLTGLTDVFSLDILWTIIGIISGEGIWQMLDSFGFPDIFIWVVRGIMGLFAALTVIFFAINRAA